VSAPVAPLANDGQVLIIGAGQAGLAAAEALRSGGHAGPIFLLGQEATGPYHRPPLSKAWLAGAMEPEQLVMRSPEVLARKGITLATNRFVTRIDREALFVVLSDGQEMAYEGLVLATGATPRVPQLPGIRSTGVHVLRSRTDAEAIAASLRTCIENGQAVAVLGGGFIGLEVAATARKLGCAVTVYESAPRLLGRVLAPVLSDWFAELHRRHGTRLRLNADVTAIVADAAGRIEGIRFADGSVDQAALLVVGIGVRPNEQLALEAGLECGGGIVVDACSRTSDPRIVAAGDCTVRRFPDGRLQRLESIQNATEQAKSAAAALLGQERPFDAVPWFWSDQFDVKLQMAGQSFDETRHELIGDPMTHKFEIRHYHGERLISVDSINDPAGHMRARKELTGLPLR